MEKDENGKFYIDIKPDPMFLAFIRVGFMLPWLANNYIAYQKREVSKRVGYAAAERKIRDALLTLGKAGFDMAEFRLAEDDSRLIYDPLTPAQA